MADFVKALPDEYIKELQKLSNNSEKMMGEMTKEAADVVKKNVLTNLPGSLSQSSEFKSCIKLSKIYKTPTDDGINTKVIITGYFYSKHNKKKVPAPLIANTFEYGTTQRGKYGYISKQPFFRKSFKKSQIEKAMLSVQKKYIKED